MATTSRRAFAAALSCPNARVVAHDALARALREFLQALVQPHDPERVPLAAREAALPELVLLGS